MNVDVAFFSEENEMGVGLVISDDEGCFVIARTILFPGCMVVATREAMGFLEALSWVKSLGISRVIVEGDAKVVVDAILAKTSGFSCYADTINKCKLILSSLQDVFVNFVKRSANHIAHAFAREACSLKVSRLGMIHRSLWLDFPLKPVSVAS